MLRLPTKVDAGAQLLEALHVVFPAGVAASRGVNHMLVGQLRQVLHYVLLLMAKVLHAELPNVVGGGVAVYLVESIVQIHKVPSQLVRQQFPCCGLAGTHVADEIDWKFHKFSGLQ